MTAPADPPAAAPSVLYAGAMSLLDVASGAAVSMRTLLAALAARGSRVTALQATLFDSAEGGGALASPASAADQAKRPVMRTVEQGIEHLIVRTKSILRWEMRAYEEEIFIRRFRQELAERRPDLVILWGGMLLETTLMREAAEAGIPVVFYLVNPSYDEKAVFQHVTLVITDSKATARLYRERHGLACHPVGKFIDVSKVKAVRRNPEYVTFINPDFHKGVNLVLPLARLAAQECPEVKFLVVQGRGNWALSAKALDFQPADFPNVRVIGAQQDMRPVYGSTRVLLLPSVWHESGARVIAEAHFNGVPVLASNRGGSAEMVGRAGRIFDVPQELSVNSAIAAPEEVVRPWLAEIRRIWHAPAYREQLSKLADAQAHQHELQHSVERFLTLVTPLLSANGRASG